MISSQEEHLKMNELISIPSWTKMFDPQIFIPKKYVIVNRHNCWLQKALCIPPEENDKGRDTI